MFAIATVCRTSEQSMTCRSTNEDGVLVMDLCICTAAPLALCKNTVVQEVHKELGGDTARQLTQLTKGCSIPCHTVSCSAIRAGGVGCMSVSAQGLSWASVLSDYVMHHLLWAFFFFFLFPFLLHQATSAHKFYFFPPIPTGCKVSKQLRGA